MFYFFTTWCAILFAVSQFVDFPVFWKLSIYAMVIACGICGHVIVLQNTDGIVDIFNVPKSLIYIADFIFHGVATLFALHQIHLLRNIDKNDYTKAICVTGLIGFLYLRLFNPEQIYSFSNLPRVYLMGMYVCIYISLLLVHFNLFAK